MVFLTTVFVLSQHGDVLVFDRKIEGFDGNPVVALIRPLSTSSANLNATKLANAFAMEQKASASELAFA